MNRKRLFLVVCVLMMYVIGAWAEVMTCLVIYEYGGKKTTYALPVKPVLTYDGSDLVVMSAEIEARHALADIEKMDFEEVDIATKIDVTSRDDRLIHATSDGVHLCGFEPGSAVYVLTTSGVLMRSQRIDRDGTSEVSLADLPTGIYLVKANKSNIKIVRK